MHADEIALDAADVRRLLAAQFPEWAELPIQRVASSGTVNAMFRLGDGMTVRLPLIPSGAPGILHESRWLPRLAPALPVRIPAVLGIGAPDDGYPLPWLVLDWIPGSCPEPGSGGAALAEDLATVILALRRVSPAGAPPSYRGGPLAALDEQVRGCLAELGMPSLVPAWEAALAAPGWDGPPTCAHADLLPGNLLVGDSGADDGRLAGVLDFAASGVGDPACDLMPAWSVFTAEGRAAFRAALDADDAMWQRGRGWALAQAAIALPYYRDSNPGMAEVARTALEALATA